MILLYTHTIKLNDTAPLAAIVESMIPMYSKYQSNIIYIKSVILSNKFVKTVTKFVLSKYNYVNKIIDIKSCITVYFIEFYISLFFNFVIYMLIKTLKSK